MLFRIYFDFKIIMIMKLEKEIQLLIKLPKISEIIPKIQRCYDQYNNQIINSFQIIQLLGRGGYSKVYKAKLNSNLFALKFYSLKSIINTCYTHQKEFSSNLQLLQLQLQITQILNHDNIVKCYKIFRNHQEVITVNQFGNLGDLMTWNQLQQSFTRNKSIYKYISTKYKTSNLLKIIQIIFKQIALGIKYLHQINVTHRDIKPSNIIGKTSIGLNDQIKLIDFNTSRHYPNSDLSYYPSGTPGFRSPQNQFGLNQGYSSKSSDIWSFGIVLYTYYHEKLPFIGQTQFQMDIKAKNNDLQFEEECPSYFVELIKKTTCKNWKQRIQIGQVIILLQKWDNDQQECKKMGQK